ncbi:MAG: hypothetical protein K6E85_01195 [Lachnospiraceae bacterium]|nr:hypothetical protein [Lachnospiraceae bacterium]
MKRFTRVLAVVLALVLVFGSIPAEAASKQIKVKSQSALDEALSSGKYTKITISSSDKVTFKIASGKYKKVQLYVKSKNATVENSAVFKKIVITDAAVFNEKAVGNTIKVADKAVTINVLKGAKVKTLALSKTSASDNSVNIQGTVETLKIAEAAKKTKLALVNNATLNKLYIYGDNSDVNISGTADKTATVAVYDDADGTTIESASAIKLVIKGDADITLDEGAEGTTVAIKEDKLDVTLQNDSNKKVTVTEADGSKKSVAAGSSYTLGEEPAPTATPTPTPEPTATPTPTPEPTPTATPTPVPKKLEVSQTTTSVLKLKGDSVKSTITDKDIKIFTKEANDVEIPSSNSIKSVTFADDVATVTMYSGFKGKQTFYVRVGGENGDTASFVSASDYMEDVARVVLTTATATVGEDTALAFKFYDQNDVDITDGIMNYDTSDMNDVPLSAVNFESYSKGSLIITCKNMETANATVYGDRISFSQEGAAVLEISLVKALDTEYKPVTITTSASVVGRNPAMGDILYTITKDDGVYFAAKDKNNAVHSLFINDDINNVFEALISIGGSYKTISELGYTLSAADENIFMVTGTASSGGVKLYALREGTTDMIVKDSSGKIVTTIKGITVRGAKKAESLEVKLSQTQLNTNAAVGDEIVIRATVKDQYGTAIENPSLKIEQVDTKTGTVALGSFTNGTLVVHGSDVTLSGTGNVITLRITCADNTARTQTVSFGVKDVPYNPADAATYIKAPYVEGSRNLDSSLAIGAQDDDTTYVYVRYTSKDGYFVKEEAGTALSAMPTTKLTAAELGIPAGTTAVFYTLQYTTLSGTGLEFITGSNANIQIDPNNIALIPVATASQLKAGNYRIQFYSITAGTSSSTVTALGSQTVINVVCPEPEFRFEKFNETATVSGTWADKLPKFFKFYWNGEQIPASCIVDADVVESASTGSTTVKSVTFAFVNSLYGPFSKTITLDLTQGSTLIYIK